MPQAQEREALALIGKNLFRREDSLNLVNLDRGLVVLLQQDKQSILPSMLEAAQMWREADPGSPEKQKPLRTILLACIIRELLQRLQTGLATEQDGWVYQKWDRKQRKLILPCRTTMRLEHSTC